MNFADCNHETSAPDIVLFRSIVLSFFGALVCARKKLRGSEGRNSYFIAHARIEFPGKPSLLLLWVEKFTVIYPRGCSKIVYRL